jgi:hypothetical protein
MLHRVTRQQYALPAGVVLQAQKRWKSTFEIGQLVDFRAKFDKLGQRRPVQQ